MAREYIKVLPYVYVDSYFDESDDESADEEQETQLVYEMMDADKVLLDQELERKILLDDYDQFAFLDLPQEQTAVEKEWDDYEHYQKECEEQRLKDNEQNYNDYEEKLFRKRHDEEKAYAHEQYLLDLPRQAQQEQELLTTAQMDKSATSTKCYSRYVFFAKNEQECVPRKDRHTKHSHHNDKVVHDDAPRNERKDSRSINRFRLVKFERDQLEQACLDEDLAIGHVL